MEFIESIYGRALNGGDISALISILFIIIFSLKNLFSTSKKPAVKTEPKVVSKNLQVEKNNKEVSLKEEPIIQVSWFERLQKGLSKTRGQVWGKLESIVGKGPLTSDQLEEIEELLYSSDIGPKIAGELIEKLEVASKGIDVDSNKIKTFLFDFLKEKMSEVQESASEDLFSFDQKNKGKTKVIMIVGVNGAGKTTTIGKLATKLKNQGANVVVGACDTFRAAAVDQLKVWCDRAGVEMIRAKEGNDPSGVAYDALQTAINSKADYCLLDTAGRLHTKSNLMDELSKNKRVLSKLDSSAPHQVLLVIDSITGQNAIRQAEEFHKALGLTGLIFTKCDGSSKAGNAVAIVDMLKVPITYIGVGESVEDLDQFKMNEYLSALLDLPLKAEQTSSVQ